MCGRFTLQTDFDLLAEFYGISDITMDFGYEFRYNIAPSQPVLAVVNDGHKNRFGYLKWGLVPSWANDAKIGYKMINARAETLDTKPAFKSLLMRRRCVVVGDSFYEWKTENGKKQPYRIKRKKSKPISFAGLWDRWEHKGDIIQTCTIITTKPNSLMSNIHDRMPVILPKEKEAIWLDRSVVNKEDLKALLIPYSDEDMEAYPVSTLVNSPKNEGVHLIESV